MRNLSLITGDLHIHPHRNELRRIEDGLDCLNWIYQTAEGTSCLRVIFAGDFLHHRFSLSVYAYAKACNIVNNYAEKGIETFFVLGNHDMYFEDRWDIHSLVPIREWATVIDKPTTLEFEGVPVDFLPYTPKPSQYLEQFKPKSSVLISHLAVAEAFLHSKYDILSVEDDSKEKEVISPAAFKGWKKVWLGHYHYGQRLDNIEYIGSPMQLTFGEADQVKHIAIFDHETLETKYVVNHISPKFLILEDVDKIKAKDVENAYVEIRTAEKIHAKFDMRRKLSQLGAREIEFVSPQTNVEQTTKALTEISAFVGNRDKLVDEFVELAEVPAHLNRDRLKKIGKSILNSQ
jgi:DNA repair exonuclease SbcCD nuclease subunit